jgi:hypothetical protein
MRRAPIERAARLAKARRFVDAGLRDGGNAPVAGRRDRVADPSRLNFALGMKFISRSFLWSP